MTMLKSQGRKFVDRCNHLLLLLLGTLGVIGISAPSLPPSNAMGVAGIGKIQAIAPGDHPLVYMTQKIRKATGADVKVADDFSLSDEKRVFKAIKEGNARLALEILEKNKHLDIPGNETFRKALEGGFKDWDVLKEKLFWAQLVPGSCYHTTLPFARIYEYLLGSALGQEDQTDGLIQRIFVKFLFGNGFLIKFLASTGCLDTILGRGSTVIKKGLESLQKIEKSAFHIMSLSFLPIWKWVPYLILFGIQMIISAALHIRNNPKASIALEILNSKKLSEKERGKLLQKTVAIMENHKIPFDRMGTLIITPENGYNTVFAPDELPELNKRMETEYVEKRNMRDLDYFVQFLVNLATYKILPYIYGKLGNGRRRVNVMHLACEQQHINRCKEILAPYAKECLHQRSEEVKYASLPTITGDVTIPSQNQEAREKFFTSEVVRKFLEWMLASSPKKERRRPEELENPFRKQQ